MSEPLDTVELNQVCTKIGVGLAMAVTPFMTAVGVKLIRNQNIRPNRFDDSSVIYLDPHFAATQRNKTVRENDVVIVRTGANIGDACVVPRSFDGSQSFTTLLVRPSIQKLHPHFLAQFINSDLGRSEVERLMAGGGKGNLNSGELERFRITLLPIDDQQRVADFLWCWDSAIETAEQLIAAKKRHFAATTHLLLTSRRRLNGFSTRWDFRRADEIFENTALKGHVNEPLLSVTQEQGVICRDMLEGRVTMPSGETGAFKLVEPGNFVISLRSFQGGLEHSRFRGLVSPAYTVLREIVEIDERFFRHYFKSADFIKRLSVAVIGIRDGKQISFQDFCSIKLPFPAVDEQKAIAAFLDEAEDEITLLRKLTMTLKTQKRGLMQKLLTGQWRLLSNSTENK